MFLPTTNGAHVIYVNVLKPLLKKYEGQIGGAIDRAGRVGTDVFNEGMKQAQDPNILLKAAQMANDAKDLAGSALKKDE
jgi:hypothetical protein